MLRFRFLLLLLCQLACLSLATGFISSLPLRSHSPSSAAASVVSNLHQRSLPMKPDRKAGYRFRACATEEASAQTVNKYGKRFNEMLDRLAQYPSTKVLSVDDPRTRTVLAGIVEGVEVPEVREAFRVLYEDYPPFCPPAALAFLTLGVVLRQCNVQLVAKQLKLLVTSIRFGGDFLFNQLEKTIAAANVKKELEESELSTSSLLQANQVFKLADTDGSGELDGKEVQAFLGAVREGEMDLAWEQAEDFVKDLDNDSSGTVSFPEFVKAAEQLLKGGDDDVVAKISLSLGGRGSARSGNKYAKRFDSMIDSFQEMEKSVDTAAIDNRRLASVFEGCLVGGRTPGVVDALKVLYVDYRIIRMCGDLIFGLVKALFQR